MSNPFVKTIMKKVSSGFFWLNLLVLVLVQRTSQAALTCPDASLEEKAGICVPKSTQTSGLLASKNLVDFIGKSINILLYVGGTIAVLFVIIGGYQYLTSGGNEEAAEKGRKTVTNAIIGIVLIALAYTIINVVVGTIGQ